MKLTRREFLMTTCLTLTSGKILYDVCNKEYEKHLIRKIYQLPEHIHLIENTTTVNFGHRDFDSLEDIVQDGYGIVLNNKLIQPTHLFNDGIKRIKINPFATVTESGEIISREASIYGKKTNKISLDWDLDMAIIDIPKGLDLPDFPCEPRRAKLGEEIYFIGNPNAEGWNIRPGYVSDPDEAKDARFTEGCFGIDMPIIPGDSGCPVVSKDYKLLGIARSFNYQGFLGYVTYIDEYIKKIEQLKNEEKNDK